MKVLIVSANTLPASPSGAAYIAGAVLRSGHTVEVFETLFSDDPAADLETHLQSFRPEVVAISIRLVNGYTVDCQSQDMELGRRLFDARPIVRSLVERVKAVSDARIILGGPGFNYFAEAWLDYLDLDYGICGEGENSFPLYLERVQQSRALDNIPGSVMRVNGQFLKVTRDRVENLDETALPAYELFDMSRYAQHGIFPAIFSKRGCAFGCIFCPYTALEGKRYRLKSAVHVVDEIEHIQRVSSPRMIMFCENSFNVPHSHAVSICNEIIARDVGVLWGSGDLKPLRISDEFVRLMHRSGCRYINLAVESASPSMLKSMNRHYTVDDVRHALECFSRQSDIPWGVSLMFGSQGETPETIAETLAVMDEFPVPPSGVWVSLGICLWTEHQGIMAEARRVGQFTDEHDLFAGAAYISPEVPETYMRNLVAQLGERAGYTVQVNKLHACHVQ